MHNTFEYLSTLHESWHYTDAFGVQMLIIDKAYYVVNDPNTWLPIAEISLRSLCLRGWKPVINPCLDQDYCEFRLEQRDGWKMQTPVYGFCPEKIYSLAEAMLLGCESAEKMESDRGD